MNIDLLGKLMAMTMSDNDAEALAFMRRANAMVRNAGLTWAQVLLPKASLAPASDDTVEIVKPKAPLSAQISYALDYLKEVDMSNSRREFLDQCQTNFNQSNYLNEFARAQLFGLVRAAKAGESLL